VLLNHLNLKIKNKEYTFYYDESNNVRKFTLSNKINGYNIEHDKNKPVSFNFTLAGVAHSNLSSTANFDDLKKAIMFQPTANEIKTKHIATGNFISMLKSKKLKGVFEWLLKSDLYIHYFNVNIEYFSYIDIIDDCVDFCLRNRQLKFDSIEIHRDYLDTHKNELYTVICANRKKFISFVKLYDYPYITGKENIFLQDLYYIVFNYYETLYSNNIQMESLLDLLSICINCGMNEFNKTTSHKSTENYMDDNYLIESFDVFYEFKSNIFPDSKHIFDTEDVIKERLDLLSMIMGEKLNYHYEASHNNLFIQVSDIIAGVVQKYFSFLSENSIKNIQEIRKNLNKEQEANLYLFKSLILKSDSENKNFLYCVIPISEYDKHSEFTFS